VSIRSRVTALATVTVLVVLLLAGFAILEVHERLLTDSVDERLAEAAAGYEEAAEDGERPAVSRPADDDSVAQLVLDGRATESVPAWLDEPIAGPPGDDDVIRGIEDVLPDEGAYRVLSVDLGDGLVLHLGATLDDVHDSRAALGRALLLSAPLIALVLGTVIWWFVGRTLRPVEAIRAQVGAIGGDDLDRRVPVPATEDEVGRLARTMNDMLDRLERSAEQQRRFVADASHELRSPLTRMRSELEVDLAHPGSADPLATHRSALEEVIGLQHLTDDLLSLARARSGAGAVEAEEVDLDDLVLAAARRLRAVDRVRLDTTDVGPARVIGNPAQLGRVIANLLDNAVRHATSTVALELRARPDGTAELVVIDDGPGIPPVDRQRVFEPFTRLDEARSPGRGGTGLGLAIARDLVVAHGGTIAIADPLDGDGGTRVVVTLPGNGAAG
jgi:signal transduction histidine kinase